MQNAECRRGSEQSGWSEPYVGGCGDRVELDGERVGLVAGAAFDTSAGGADRAGTGSDGVDVASREVCRDAWVRDCRPHCGARGAVGLTRLAGEMRRPNG